ncbi:MAG: MoxR family ATPase [SAR324 cluster bacterium]|nr:MoxR family ATPase [SAR324 cluster bacterium]
MSYTNIQAITEQVKSSSAFLHLLYQEIGKVIVGQKEMLDSLMTALIADGHVLMEGLPGLAKTTAIKALSDATDVSFQRIQFTPDLLPADVVGTQVYEQATNEFSIKKGPVFANFVLADEINRAPAKVQSAMLETMQEKQVTIGGQTFRLPLPFLVLATQNPIEQEGTYPLPEAQIDRFMLKVKVDYPSPAEELEIIKRSGMDQTTDTVMKINPVISGKEILEARQVAKNIHIEETLMQYIISIVFATRQPAEYQLPELQSMIAYGASPRASIALLHCAKAQAFLNQRGFVIPQDIKDVSFNVLRHRIILSYEAEAEDMTPETIIQNILDKLPTP